MFNLGNVQRNIAKLYDSFSRYIEGIEFGNEYLLEYDWSFAVCPIATSRHYN